MTVVEESRTIAQLAQIKDHLLLARVSWDTYEALLQQCSDRRLRHTYDRGRLEFMTLSRAHEIHKWLLGRFVETWAEETNIRLAVGGGMTIRRADLERGLEADECYWIANEPRVRGRLELDLRRDPPPDLAIEVEVSRSVLNRLDIFAALGVAEIWRFDGSTLQVGILGPDDQYTWGTRSPTFSDFPFEEVLRLLQQVQVTDHLSLVRAFRGYVRAHLQRRSPLSSGGTE